MSCRPAFNVSNRSCQEARNTLGNACKKLYGENCLYSFLHCRLA